MRLWVLGGGLRVVGVGSSSTPQIPQSVYLPILPSHAPNPQCTRRHFPASFSIVSSGCHIDRNVGSLLRWSPGRFGRSPAPCKGMFAVTAYTEFAGSFVRR